MAAWYVRDIGGSPATAPARTRWRLDWFDIAAFVALAALSMWVVVFNLWEAGVHHLVWTGADGDFPQDQLQYMAWIRDASRHVLSSDLFVVGPTPHDYLEPMALLAGALTAIGLAPWLALLLLKPFAVTAILLAVRAYSRRTLQATLERRAALTLGLFFGAFGVLGDDWIPFETWGYTPAVLATAAMTGALLAYDHARRTGRQNWCAPALGLLASWLHPWQGEELLILIVCGEMALIRLDDQSPASQNLSRFVATATATALPLLYYGALDRLDSIWHEAASAAASPRPLGPILLPLLPLIAPAALAYWFRPRTFLEVVTRLWPFAVMVVYLLSENGIGGGPLHAFTGITIPLAILAVSGVQRGWLRHVSGRRPVIIVLVAAGTIPATIHMMRAVPSFVGRKAGAQNLITHAEQRAIDYLASAPAPGAVLTPYGLGTLIPADTGRSTYIGDAQWSVPDDARRSEMTDQLFHGQLSPTAARMFVLGTRARFLLAPCGTAPTLPGSLEPIVTSVRSFGCVTVDAVR